MKLGSVAVFSVAMVSFTAVASASPVTIDLSEAHQTVDGFGFFGGMNVYWGDPSTFFSADWGKQIIDDLGLTIWRNEYYPPSDAQTTQDTSWDQQKAVVQGLAAAAAASKVPLKMIATVWSPPAAMKCATDSNNAPIDGTPNPGGTRKGGVVCPSDLSQFASWLSQGVQNYADLGVDLYALSIQNEPLFAQAYNSSLYSPAYYAQTLASVAPEVRKAFPKLKFFGSENMLEMEAGADRQYFYHKALMANQAALKELDIWAVHGYSDGVVPTEASRTSALWTTLYNEYAQPTGKPVWMTETSGFNDTWNGGAMNLAMSIYAALRYGNAAAWVWWQGSDLHGIDGFSLMRGTQEMSKRYYVHKQFARFIRPGAKRVKATTTDPNLLVVAFQHDALDNTVIVAINATDQPTTLDLQGEGLPQDFELFVTNATDNCADKGSVSQGALTVPAQSLATFVSGNVYEAQAPDAPAGQGSGGSQASGGSAGSVGGDGAAVQVDAGSFSADAGVVTDPFPLGDAGVGEAGAAFGTDESATTAPTAKSTLNTSAGGGCDVGARTDAASGSVALLLLSALWLRRRRVQAIP